jgi:hypothetical protein
MPNAGGMVEDRTAGSDPKIRFSSGGPISLDPSSENFVCYFYFAYFANENLQNHTFFRVSEVSRKNKKGGVIIPDDNIT